MSEFIVRVVMLGIAFAIAYLGISVVLDVYESDLTTLSKIVVYVFAGGHLALFAINFFLVAIGHGGR